MTAKERLNWQNGLRSSPAPAKKNARPSSRRGKAPPLSAYGGLSSARRRRSPSLKSSLHEDAARAAARALRPGTAEHRHPMPLDLARTLLDEMWSRATASRGCGTLGTTPKLRATRVNDTWSPYEHALPEKAVQEAMAVLDVRGVTPEHQRWLLQLLLRVEADPLLDWRAKLQRLDRYLVAPIAFAGSPDAYRDWAPHGPWDAADASSPATKSLVAGTYGRDATPPEARPDAAAIGPRSAAAARPEAAAKTPATSRRRRRRRRRRRPRRRRRAPPSAASSPSTSRPRSRRRGAPSPCASTRRRRPRSRPAAAARFEPVARVSAEEPLPAAPPPPAPPKRPDAAPPKPAPPKSPYAAPVRSPPRSPPPDIVDEMRILALMKRSALVLPMGALLLWRGTVRRARNRALLDARASASPPGSPGSDDDGFHASILTAATSRMFDDVILSRVYVAWRTHAAKMVLCDEHCARTLALGALARLGANRDRRRAAPLRRRAPSLLRRAADRRAYAALRAAAKVAQALARAARRAYARGARRRRRAGAGAAARRRAFARAAAAARLRRALAAERARARGGDGAEARARRAARRALLRVRAAATFAAAAARRDAAVRNLKRWRAACVAARSASPRRGGGAPPRGLAAALRLETSVGRALVARAAAAVRRRAADAVRRWAAVRGCWPRPRGGAARAARRVAGAGLATARRDRGSGGPSRGSATRPRRARGAGRNRAVARAALDAWRRARVESERDGRETRAADAHFRSNLLQRVFSSWWLWVVGWSEALVRAGLPRDKDVFALRLEDAADRAAGPFFYPSPISPL
ncbi:hypothetical protein JL720_13092 [Aureococcus anophagefferens]|nr:hypothetical protein JL720_13092 [Aureococcus anophagefferens]